MAKNLVRCLSHAKGVGYEVTTPTTPASGAVCLIGNLPGVALTDEGSDGITVVNTTPNIWRVPVNVTAEQVVGADLYYDTGDDKLDEVSANRVFVGTLVEAVAANFDGMAEVQIGNSVG